MTGKYEKADERKWKLREAVRQQREADIARAVIAFYNARLAEKKDPWFAPTIKAALVTQHHWLFVLCPLLRHRSRTRPARKAAPAGSHHPDGAARRALPALQRAWPAGGW